MGHRQNRYDSDKIPFTFRSEIEEIVGYELYSRYEPPEKTEYPITPIVKEPKPMPRSPTSIPDATEIVIPNEISEIEHLLLGDNIPAAVPKISMFGKTKDSRGNFKIRMELSLFTFRTVLLFTTVQKKKPPSRSRKKKVVCAPLTFDEIETPSPEPSFEELNTDIEGVEQPRCSTPIQSQMSLADFYRFFATEEINDISVGGSTNAGTIIIEHKEVTEEDRISTIGAVDVPIIDVSKEQLDRLVEKPAEEIETQNNPTSKKKTKPKVVKKYNCDQCPKSFNKVPYFIYIIIFCFILI